MAKNVEELKSLLKDKWERYENMLLNRQYADSLEQVAWIDEELDRIRADISDLESRIEQVLSGKKEESEEKPEEDGFDMER